MINLKDTHNSFGWSSSNRTEANTNFCLGGAEAISVKFLSQNDVVTNLCESSSFLKWAYGDL